MNNQYKQRIGLRAKAKYANKMRCNTLICVLENPKSLTNVCNVMRNINSFGVSRLYVIDGNEILSAEPTKKETEFLNRVSSSAVRYTYIKKFKTTQECLDYLKKNNYVSMVTSPYTSEYSPNANLLNGNYTHKKLAVWFGNEADGISEEAKKNANLCIQIETNGIIESLNLGNSTGIVLHYITYQRRIQGQIIKQQKSIRKENKLSQNNLIIADNQKKIRKRSNSI